MKISPRRPNKLLRGSLIQTPKSADEMYGAALTNPTIHSSRLPSGVPISWSSPNSAGKDKSNDKLITAIKRNRPTGTVGSSLIPSLGSSTDSAGKDCKVEHPRVGPLASSRLAEPEKVVLIQFRDLLVLVRSLSDQGTSSKDIGVFGHAGLGTKLVDIGEESLLGDTVKRVDELLGFRVIVSGTDDPRLSSVEVLVVLGVFVVCKVLVCCHLVSMGKVAGWSKQVVMRG
jgi:hypothetical protein